MGKITVTPCGIEGLYVIEPKVFKDERGYFVETYNQNDRLVRQHQKSVGKPLGDIKLLLVLRRQLHTEPLAV